MTTVLQHWQDETFTPGLRNFDIRTVLVAVVPFLVWRGEFS